MAGEDVADLRRRIEALEGRRTLQVERIDVVEPDGTVRLVLSNTARAPDPVVDGVTFKRDDGNAAGLIFYNADGDECGGLVFENRGAALLFDQFKQDQLLGLMYDEAPGRRRAGLYVWDRTDEPFPAVGGAVPMFAGRRPDGMAAVELHDDEGRVRLRLGVTAPGAALVEFLDEGGAVTACFPA